MAHMGPGWIEALNRFAVSCTGESDRTSSTLFFLLMALASVVLPGLGFGAWVSKCWVYRLKGSNPYRAFWGSMLVCGV